MYIDTRYAKLAQCGYDEFEFGVVVGGQNFMVSGEIVKPRENE